MDLAVCAWLRNERFLPYKVQSSCQNAISLRASHLFGLEIGEYEIVLRANRRRSAMLPRLFVLPPCCAAKLLGINPAGAHAEAQDQLGGVSEAGVRPGGKRKLNRKWLS